MPVTCCGGLDGESLAETGAFGQGAQHDFGHRRAADVAGAHEGDPEGLRGVTRGFRSRHAPIVVEMIESHSRENVCSVRWSPRSSARRASCSPEEDG
jgi:hypothetical protein